MTSLVLLDTETMFDALVSDAAADAGITAIQSLHADSFEEVPFVAWQTSNNGQVDHAFWSITLILNVVAEARELFSYCQALYAAVTSWGIPMQGVVDGVGAVNTVRDGAVFDKTFETHLHGKFLSQTTATFSISVEQL